MSLINPHLYRLKTTIVPVTSTKIITTLPGHEKQNIAKWKLIIYSIIGVITYSIVMVVTPMYIDAFKKNEHKSNPYFVSLSTNFFFAIIFIVMSMCESRYTFKSFVGSFNMQKRLFINSISYCIFYLLMLEVSPQNRTPVDL